MDCGRGCQWIVGCNVGRALVRDGCVLVCLHDQPLVGAIMTEDEMLYQALSSSLGLVVRGDRARLRSARAKLARSDPALLDLAIIGPNPAGKIFLLRNDKARASGYESSAPGPSTLAATRNV